MLRVLVIFLLVALIAIAAAWFADRPGELTISWLGYEIETSFMLALAAVFLAFLLIVMAWTIARGILGAPGVITNFFRARRQARGFDALTRGVVAAGAGDAATASRYATLAHRSLGDTPLAQLLRAQAAQLSGDHMTVRWVFDDMLQNSDTEALGLRGLFVQAQQDGEIGKARHYAERALSLNPRLIWAAQAMLVMQAAAGDWKAVERTIDECRRNRLFSTDEANRKIAVAATARALAMEETDADGALEHALRAHKLAAELVPAAAVAGRLLAATGQPRKAAKILEKTWRLSPHPDLAEIHGAAYTGRSPRERLKRVKALVKKIPAEVEGPIAVARAAVEAREWDQAREVLTPLSESQPAARVCELMAEIAHGDEADEGRAREWLARAIYAPRDPVWVADGYVSDRWLPVSPVNGELDAFSWRVPADGLMHSDAQEEEHRPLEPSDAGGSEEPEPVETTDGSTAVTALAPIAAAQVAGAAEAREADAVAPETEVPEDAVEEETVSEAAIVSTDTESELGVTSESAGTEDEPENEKQDARTRRPKVFVPPRPPDDPGPEPRDDESGNWFQALFAR